MQLASRKGCYSVHSFRLIGFGVIITGPIWGTTKDWSNMRTKSKRSIFPIALLTLVLALSGCTKQESDLVLNADGTLSGELTTAISDNITSNFSFVDFIWETQTPLEVINVTAESRDGCTATNARFYVAEGQVSGLNYASIRLDIANVERTVYAHGDVTASSNEGDIYVEIAQLQLVPKSENNSDCAYLDTVNSGALALASNGIGNTLGSVNFENNVLQIANIPPAERIHYLLLTQLANAGEEENSRWPEGQQCISQLSDSRFDLLNDRQLMPGEFLALVEEIDGLKVVKEQTRWITSCEFSGISLSALNRVIPEDPEPPTLDPGGLWRSAEDGITWDFLAETMNPEEEILEINMDGVYTSNEMQAIVFALETGTEIDLSVSGVVLSTNGDFDQSKNKVSWRTSGTWGESPYLTIPGGADMREPSMNVLVGNTVAFKTNKTTWSNAKTFGGLKPKLASLKKASVDTIQIVAIKKVGLSGAAATSNQKLLKKRVTAIKNKLTAAKVKADIEVVYLTPNSITGGDTKYANKVVVQPISD